MTHPPHTSTPSLDVLLARFPVERPPSSSADAAVTIVLREGLSELEVLLIERASHPDDPASGQVALPGGHVSKDDGNLVQTALRELEEEVGLSRQDLADDPRYVSTVHARRFGLDVGVFVARLGSEGRTPAPRSPSEVARVFWLPRSSLETTRQVERETSVGTLPVHATVHDGHVLWGFTRRVLRDFFDLPHEKEAFGSVFAPKASPPS
ncbi:MAG TPA: CoA pyrophosphatase [Thermoplasmata archaeon]|nr:CoA pyrophosphatase [Thermoplasmata archaeon]